MATMKDIADEAGVSVKTVARFLNGENKENRPSSIERAKQIRDIAQRMKFRPNAMARTMRTNKSYLIGVLIRNSSDIPFTALSNYETILGIYQRLEEFGYEMCLVHQSDVEHRSRIFREQMLDGLIAIGHLEPELYEAVTELFENCVWTDSNKQNKTLCVRRDENHAGRLVGEHVAACGYEHVIWLGWSPHEKVQHYSQTQRLDGLREGLGQKLASQLQMRPIATNLPDGINLILGNLKPRTAIIAYDIPQARAVLEHLSYHRMFAGEHVGLACPDDAYDMSRIGSKLCRVTFDRYAMGQIAAGLMLDQLAGKTGKSKLITGQWIDGKTLGKQV
jgi:DNA-binding LacI/PurR family transcriptional regulator